jgi:hypothetical protein
MAKCPRQHASRPREAQGRNGKRADVPLLLVLGRVLLAVVDYFAFSRQRTLYKGALLLMEFAEDAKDSTLVDYAAALASPASVAGPLSPCADVCNGASGGRDRLALDQILFARRGLRLLARASGGDGDGSLPRHGHGGLYSHCRRHGGGLVQDDKIPGGSR